jgi:repressor LexA
VPVAKRAPRPRPLTDRQIAIHTFMLEYQKEHGMPPTLREIGDHFEISSTNGVQDHMRALERKGAVDHRPLVSRGWRAV